MHIIFRRDYDLLNTINWINILKCFRKLDEIVNCDTNTICKIKMENIAFEMDESGMF